MNSTQQEAVSILKFGTVCESRPGFVRVQLPDFDNIKTSWLPVSHDKSQDDKSCYTLDIGEQVGVLLDQRGEDGMVVGAIYSEADASPTADNNVWIKQFKDGCTIEYNRETHVLKVSGLKEVTIEAADTIKLNVGTKVVIDCPETEVTGNLKIGGALLQGAGGSSATLNGNLQVNGNVAVNGNIDASGDILAEGANSNHHSH